MVKKRSKFKINSGNTFKFGEIGHKKVKGHCDNYTLKKSFINRHIQPSNFKVLNDRILSTAEHLVNDGGIEAELFQENVRRQWQHGTEYTLNKHKRWLLPDLVKDGVAELSCGEGDREGKENGFKMTMVERELEPRVHTYYVKSRRRNDVKDYYDSRYDHCK